MLGTATYNISFWSMVKHGDLQHYLLTYAKHADLQHNLLTYAKHGDLQHYLMIYG